MNAQLDWTFLEVSLVIEVAQAPMSAARTIRTQTIACILGDKSVNIRLVRGDALATVPCVHIAEAGLRKDLVHLTTVWSGELCAAKHLLGRNVATRLLEHF